MKMIHACRLLPLFVVVLAVVTVWSVCPMTVMAAEPVVVVEPGSVRAVVYAPPRVADATARGQIGQWGRRDEATLRVRLRESVEDLARYLSQMTGSKVPVVYALPEGEHAPEPGVVPILIAEIAESRFGPARALETAWPDQVWRLAVTHEAVGLMGGSDLGVSYAIYELLDRLSCR